jgi:hypothetical protein
MLHQHTLVCDEQFCIQSGHSMTVAMKRMSMLCSRTAVHGSAMLWAALAVNAFLGELCGDCCKVTLHQLLACYPMVLGSR